MSPSLSTNSQILEGPLSALPPPPAGANPFAYWSAVVRSVLYRRPGNGSAFDARLIVLSILFVYLTAAAIVSLVLTLVDYRRRGKSVFLWKLVLKERGRYIVGNQQLLEPILTIVVAAIFLAHTVVDWLWTFGKGSYAVVAPLRLATWSTLFVQLWIVGWASLQSFVITAGEGNIPLRYFPAKVANTVFLFLGVAFTVLLVVGVGLASADSRAIWLSYRELQRRLIASIPIYPAAVDDATANRVADLWSQFLDKGKETVDMMRIEVMIFAVSASVTTLTSMGGIALLVLVRRQISANYSNFVGSQNQPAFDLPPVAGSAREVEIDEHGAAGSADSAQSAPAQPPPGAFAISITPATPLIPEDPRFSSSTADTEDATIASSQKSSLGDDTPPEPSGGSERKKKGRRRPPSRSTVRRMAGNHAGGVAAAHARNLQQLHRAESDLFITCCSSISTSIAFVALSSWVYVVIPTADALTWGELEVAIFLGSWLYAVIHGIALSAHLYTLVQNFTHPPKAAAHSTAGFRPPAFLNSAWSGSEQASPAVTRVSQARTAVRATGLESQDEAEDVREDPSWLSPGAARRIGDEYTGEQQAGSSIETQEIRAEKDEDGFEEVKLPTVTEYSRS
ncbi:hypothetical protein JCM11251_002979 [Rhodosporidiobolus azoricus]